MTAPLFLAPPACLATLAPGDSFVLNGEEARHATQSRRLRAGEQVQLSDGEGLRLTCEVLDASGGTLRVRICEVAREDTEPLRLALAQALAKGDRDELAIQAATELGADLIVPWQAARSVVVWRGDKAARSVHRWAAIVREAAKQSRRSFVPQVGEPVDTGALARLAAQVVSDGGAAWVLDAGGESLAQVALPPAGAHRATLLVIVGPEGGIGEDELATLERAGARRVAVGRHILRTSTAGPAALAAISLRLGRW